MLVLLLTGDGTLNGREYAIILHWNEAPFLLENWPFHPRMDLDRVELRYTFYNSVRSDSTESERGIVPIFSCDLINLSTIM